MQMAKKVSVGAFNMVCSILGLLLLLLNATSSNLLPTEKLEGVRKSTAPRLQPASDRLETPTAKAGAQFMGRRGHDDEQRSVIMAGGQEVSRELSRNTENLQPKATIKPAQKIIRAAYKEGTLHKTVEVAMKAAAKLYDHGGGNSNYKHVQLMERQRETIWAEMRGPKYRVDNTRAFHADYAEAHPHPPRNN